MLYREIIAVCSQINTERINTLCGQKVVRIVTTGLYTFNQSSVTHYAAECQCYTVCPLVLPHLHLRTTVPHCYASSFHLLDTATPLALSLSLSLSLFL